MPDCEALWDILCARRWNRSQRKKLVWNQQKTRKFLTPAILAKLAATILLGDAADLRILSSLHGSQAAHRDSQNLDITTLVKITTQGCDYVDHLREPLHPETLVQQSYYGMDLIDRYDVRVTAVAQLINPERMELSCSSHVKDLGFVPVSLHHRLLAPFGGNSDPASIQLCGNDDDGAALDAPLDIELDHDLDMPPDVEAHAQ